METNDIVTKNFESYADVAADIINVLLHEGRRVFICQSDKGG